jgi:hypothetical protein
VFGRQRRTFLRTTVVDASVEQVWDVLRDWKAMYWIVTGSVLALPVPDRPEGVGGLWCCWQRLSDGSLKAGVFEVVEFQPGRSIALLERQRPDADSRVEFLLEDRGERTQVRITVRESMYRYEWGQRGPGVNERYLSRLAEGLEFALADVVPGPHDVETLVFQPNASAPEAVHEIRIQAPLEEIWRVNQDEDGTLISVPELEKQWLTQHDGRLLQVQLVRRADSGLGCAFQLMLRPEHFRDITRAWSLEVEQQLLPQQDGAVLRTTYRWDPKSMTAEAIADSARRWLLAVKAEAEGGARQSS